MTADRLAALYAGVETQPLPTEFATLLDRLDRAHATSHDEEAHLSRID